MTEKTIALLVAAGNATRMGEDLPKPYLPLGQETILRHAARTFLSHPEIDGVRVVIRREHHGFYKKSMEGLTLFPCVIGGETRQDSVRLGLESLTYRAPTHVLVHDVARPLASHALISRVIAALGNHKAVIPTMPITDTIKRAHNGRIQETIPREQLVAVQTPQGFHYDMLLTAHQALKGDSLSDDAALIEKMGGEVAMVDGESKNSKITTPMDLKHMQTMLSLHTETRTGYGYDVHPLKSHDHNDGAHKHAIKLCGVSIPFGFHLVGHSDADVGLHALVDAILSTISAGDIGMHFPPDDRKWQGADSSRFLLHAYELLTNRGGELVHLDITLICERPKIAPHRDQMIHHIGQLLKLSPDRVSIKATTSEKLGFTGRGEGIAAHAIVTVRLPRT